VDDLLESALSTADPHLQALAWEMKTRVAMAEQDWMGAREYLQQAVVIVEKFEVLVAAWQVHATAWQFYRHTKEDKPAEASRGRGRSLHPQDCEFFRKGRAAARVISFRSPYCSRPRRVGKQESGLLRILETEDGGRNREVAAPP